MWSLLSVSILLSASGVIKVNTIGVLLTHLVSQASVPEAFIAVLCVSLQWGGC